MRLIRLLKRDLAKESSIWVEEGIISVPQAEAICARYGLDYHKLSEYSLGYNVLIGLGYLFIGLAVITLLSANWEDIPRGLRMTGLLALTMATQLLALKKYTGGQQSQATGLFFLGSLFYGASIMLIAQIYHIEEHFPNGILWWALGVLPFAFLLRSSVLLLLTVALAFIWFFVESALSYFPLLFLVFMGFTAWHVFRVKQSLLLFLALLVGLGFWSEYLLAWHMRDYYRLDFGPENIAFAISLIILYAGIAEWLGSRTDRMLVDYGTVLGIWILRFALLTLFVFSFKDPWRELLAAEWEQIGLTIALAISLPLLSLALVHLAGRPIAPLAVLTLYFVITLFAAIHVNTLGSDYLGIYFQIVDNIVLIAFGIWLIIRGIKDGLTHYFFLGVLTILLTGLLRYIDLVGDYVGAAILFMIFAVLLLATARYWKLYKKRMQQGSVHE